MIVNFIEKGFLITAVEMNFPPDNEDRIVIGNDMYVVDDRIFNIGKNTSLDVYVTCFYKQGIGKV